MGKEIKLIWSIINKYVWPIDRIYILNLRQQDKKQVIMLLNIYSMYFRLLYHFLGVKIINSVYCIDVCIEM